jgi:hypothetical protein
MMRTKAAREMFEDSADSDFITLMRAYDFAKANGFSFERCRSHGINAQVARQVEQTCQQILHAAQQQGLQSQSSSTRNDDALRAASWPASSTNSPNAAPRQTRVRPHRSTPRPARARKRGEDADFFVAANLRETPSRQTLLSLATAVQPAWIAEMFPSISAPPSSTSSMPKTNASPP